MSTNSPTGSAPQPHPDKRIAVIAARWNEHIVSRLLAGVEDRLTEVGMPRDSWEVFRVPGAFELPGAALVALESGRFHAAVCLGCVIRGETWHFEAVAGEAARGVAQVALTTRKPCIFGVLTVESEAQALARTGGPHGHAGRAAADAALDMLTTLAAINSPARHP